MESEDAKILQHNSLIDNHYAAVVTWLWVAKQLGFSKDVATLIGKLVLDMPIDLRASPFWPPTEGYEFNGLATCQNCLRVRQFYPVCHRHPSITIHEITSPSYWEKRYGITPADLCPKIMRIPIQYGIVEGAIQYCSALFFGV